MTIAIHFGDNDFINTYEPLGKILLQAFRNGSLDESTSKEKIVFIVNQLIYGVYVLFQNNCKYEEEKDFSISNTKEYLQITTENVMLDDEAYQYLETMRSVQNREVLVVDTNIDYLGNTPVYIF